MNRTLAATTTARPPPWHAMPSDEVLSILEVDPARGLTQQAVEERRAHFGRNQLPAPETTGPLRRFLRQFHNTLIYVLLVSSVFTAFLEEWVDTAVILGVVMINSIIGFVQEGKAERALESIRALLSPTATVLRDGEVRQIDADDLVPGDVVLLGSGDRVPADLRVLEARAAEVQEASLTGESEPVDKDPAPVREDAPLGDRKSLAFSSTLVTSGRLRGVVVATGPRAEIGHIGELVSGVEPVSTPLLRHIDAFGRRLSLAIVVASGLVFALGYFLRDFSATEMFMAVVSLAVAAIPEGLPAVMTITLALGVQHMARRKAIVRRLPAVETLGAVTVACVDKTGTLTKNEMTVTEVACAGKLYRVTGAGYDPHGDFWLGDERVRLEEHPWLIELARAGLLASDARIRRKNGAWHAEGAPTEAGMVVLARKAGLDDSDERRLRPRVDVVPFESERRYMATLHRDPGGFDVLYVKGAPERILALCSRCRTESGDAPLDPSYWAETEQRLAGSGRRVLALATKRFGPDQAPELGAGLEDGHISDLTLLGFVGIIDPPRPEATEAIRLCREAGIRVKMITGDHALTASSIAAQMGIGDGEHAVTGRQIERSSREELVELIADNDVFARSSPEHKLRIMDALQSQGHVVAMTGDGVNDAPALKKADVGIAMGIKGSEAAKEAAEMVLADDNFATIERAVEEGRTIYDNLVKCISYILPTNGAQSLVVLAAMVFDLRVMPVTPVQILWINMVTAVTLAMALAFEPAEEDVMRRPPRPPTEPILDKLLFWRVVFVSVLIAAVSILVFQYWFRRGDELAWARTTAVNTLATGQLFYLFSSRFISRSSFGVRALVGNPAVPITCAALIALQLAFTYLPAMQSLFGTAPIDPTHWASAWLAGACVFVLVEIEKAVLRRLRPSSRKPARDDAIAS